MQREPRAFLWDVRESAQAIQSFVADMEMVGYATGERQHGLEHCSKRLARSAWESVETLLDELD